MWPDHAKGQFYLHVCFSLCLQKESYLLVISLTTHKKILEEKLLSKATLTQAVWNIFKRSFKQLSVWEARGKWAQAPQLHLRQKCKVHIMEGSKPPWDWKQIGIGENLGFWSFLYTSTSFLYFSLRAWNSYIYVFFSLQLHIGKPPEGWRGVTGKVNSHLLFVFWFSFSFYSHSQRLGISVDLPLK